MTPDQIKAAPHLKLKPNPLLSDPETPYPYQRRGVLMMLVRPRMVLGDDVGLGKTLEAVVHYSYLKSLKPDYRALVLTERVALKQWQETVAWLTPKLRARIITSNTHEDAKLRVSAFRNQRADVLISTYSMLYNYGDHIRAGLGPTFVLYADEPQFFKNTQTKLYKQVETLADQATRAYGLTATVIENRLEEAFAIFRALAPDAVGSKSQFQKDHVVFKKLRGNGRVVVAGYKNLDLFRKKIEPFFYGRLQTDPEVKQALPDVITKNVEIEMGKAQSEKVLEATDRIIQMPDGEIKQPLILPALLLAQQLVDDPGLIKFDLPSAKLESLVEMLSGSLKGQKVLIHSKLRTMVDRIEAALDQEKIENVRITGAENDLQRFEAQRRFQDTTSGSNVLLMTRAGAKAVNLQAAAHLIFYDLCWSYGLYRQIVGRMARTGSNHQKVGVYHLMAAFHPDVASRLGSSKTIDHHTLAVIQRKKHLFNILTGDVTEIDTNPADLIEIFREIKNARKP